MTSAAEQKARPKRYFVKVEGEVHRWCSSTITTEQIIELGGWDPAAGAIMIDEDGKEATLEPGQVIELRPGRQFGKRICFKRGGHA